MKKILALLLAALMLTGCGSNTVAEVTTAEPAAEAATEAAELTPLVLTPAEASAEIPYTSRYDAETQITLSDEGVLVDTLDSGAAEDCVVITNDIIYYEDRDSYASGNPYGEGTDADKHTAEEAAAHTVVNITAPGAYRVSGKLSAGQIRIDLGDTAYEDPEAVVELILDGADITCTVAPAILFLNTYECDGQWSEDDAKAEVDTAAAGANLILEGENTVTGSYVARIYKDVEGEKKLWKQDGAIYSYMSMNVYGPGSLDLTADNEGLDTELHLTVNGGDITIRSGNDGINTNEDNVSVTTINAGTLHIIAGLGEEGDGIDSNGYLVINGGTVVASGNPAGDAGMDSDKGTHVNGGTVIALGSSMDGADNASTQVTMNLQFAQAQTSGSSLVIADESGTVLFAYDPGEDEILASNTRQYTGAIVSSPYFAQSSTCNLYIGSTISGEEDGGVYDPLTVSSHTGGTLMQYGSAGFGGRGGMGGMGPGGRGNGNFANGEMPEDFTPGEMPEGFTPGEMPTLPEGETMPEDFDPSQMGERPDRGGRGQRGEDGERPTLPEGETMPEDFDPSQMGERPDRGDRNPQGDAAESSTAFTLTSTVNTFSGITAVSA